MMSCHLLPGVAADDATNHRLYDLEVIELNEDVSCILMLPPVESVCTIPGHHEEITQQPTSTLLPVQIFEMSEYCIGTLLSPVKCHHF